MTGNFRWIFLTLFAAFWTGTISGCDRSTAVSRKSVPKVVVISQVEKVAEQDSEAQVMTYILANHGDADLRLGPISTSCGCSSATISRELVSPGDTAVVTIVGLPPATGSRPVRIHVITNDPNESSLSLIWQLTSHPNPPKLLTSAPTVDLGILRPGQIPPARSVVFDILEDRETPPIARETRVDQEFCRIEGGMIDEVNAVDPKFVTRSYRYCVSFLRAPAVGTFVRQIEVLQRGDDAGPWLTIPIRGIVLPAVRAIPDSVRFAEWHAGNKPSAKLMIICDDQSGALAAECIAHDPRTTVRVLKRETDRILFEVECEALGDDRAIQPFHFRVNEPLSTTIDIPVYYSGIKLKGEYK
jgi:hypothetical protein